MGATARQSLLLPPGCHPGTSGGSTHGQAYSGTGRLPSTQAAWLSEGVSAMQGHH